MYMDPVVHQLFPQVVRLLLSIPCISAEDEKSFSGLCRLKTYLRNSLSLQARLNRLTILHIHQEITDGIYVLSAVKDSVVKSDSRMFTFVHVCCHVNHADSCSVLEIVFHDT